MNSSPLNDQNVDIQLSESKLSPLHNLEFVKSPSAGAIVYFGGTTRDSMDGKAVTLLSYEAYIPLALKTLDSIARQALAKWPQSDPNRYICKVSIHHRLGVVPVEEESVIIAVSAGHRQEGWAAGEWILEQIKQLAEIWKNEHYQDGTTYWRENAKDQRPAEQSDDR